MTNIETLKFLKTKLAEINQLQETEYLKVAEIFKQCIEIHLSIPSENFSDTILRQAFVKSRQYITKNLFQHELISLKKGDEILIQDGFFHVKASILMMTAFLEN